MKKIMFFTVLFLLIQNLCAVQMQQTRMIPEKGMEILTSEQLQNPQPVLESYVNSRDNRLGLLWQTSDPIAIAENIAVSQTTGQSFVAWCLNSERVSLYQDNPTPLWEYGANNGGSTFPRPPRLL